MRALIVDDKPENRYLLRALLQGHGWDVEEADNGSEALTKARRTPPDLIISDLLMPVMDGYTLLRHWKADANLRTIPFVVYTATYTEAKDERLALDLGAEAFLIKPLEPEPFMARIQEVLSKAVSGELPQRGEPIGEETGLFKEYSEILVNKLEAKVFELEKLNQVLQEEIKRREQTEAALIQSRQDWEDVFQSIGQPTIIVDLEHGVVAANKQCVEVTGKPVSDLIGMKCYEVFHEDGKRPDGCPMEALIESGSPDKVEMEVATIGGHSLVSCTPIFDAEGNIQKVIHAATDISERIKMEKALRGSEEKLSGISNSVQDAIILVDNRGKIDFWNPAAERMFGHAASEAIGENVHELLAPQEYFSAYSTGIAEFAKGGQGDAIGRTVELEALRRNGEKFPVELSLSSFQMDGRWHAVGSARDITDRKTAEAALRESEELYRLTLSNISDAVFVTDEQGTFTFICPNVDVLFGYSPEQVSSMNNIATLLGENLFVPEELEATEEIRNIGRNVVDRSGRTHDALISVKRVSIRGGTRLYTCRDVTELKRAENELRESEQKFRGVFENDHVVMLIIDPETGKIIDGSPGACAFYGYDREQLKKKKISEINTLPVEELFKRLQMAKAKQRQFYDFQHLLASGEARDVEACTGPIIVGGRTLLFSVVTDVTERKRFEDELKASELRYRLVVENSSDVIWTMDPFSRRFTFFSGSVERMFGYSPKEALTLSLEEWVLPEWRSMAFDLLRQLVNEERSTILFEGQLHHKSGRTLWSEIIASLWKDAESGLTQIVGVSRDVTERKESERKLHESEERFRQVAEVAGEWIWELDGNGLFQYCSSAVEQLLGYSPQELVGQKYFWEVLDPDAHRESGEQGMKFFKGRKPFHGFVNPHIRKDGEVIVLETSGAPILDDDGTFHGYRGINKDVTERVRAAESRELLAAVVEHAAEAIIVTDIHGNIKYVNPAFERISGYAHEEALGSNPRILNSGKQDDKFYRDLWTTITDGKIWRGIFINKKKDGSLFEEEATISPIMGAGGKIVNYVAVKRDVTREAQLQRQLVQSQKMEAIGTLAGGIAHDFNNIVFAIIGYTELALEDLPAGAQARWDLERVLGAGRRAGEMVKQILTFSRQGEPAKQPLDLSPIVKEGLKFLRSSIPSTIEIRQDVQPSLGKVHADPTQIHQVLMNLCTNASHAMGDSKGILSVDLSEVAIDAEYAAQHLDVAPGKYINLTVSDTGHGIPPDIIHRIFEPFFTTKEAGEGTGMGLAVIHGIVKDHGGVITVYSEPGQGTTFNVFFPVMNIAEKAESPQAVISAPTGRERILLVDDEQILIEMGQAILERLGYKVVTKTNPVDALELFRSAPQHFDLVITDLTMPKMTGLELAGEIAILRAGMPVILCTGFGHKFTGEEAEQAKIVAVIRKPLSKKDVAETVRKVLDRKGAIQSDNQTD